MAVIIAVLRRGRQIGIIEALEDIMDNTTKETQKPEILYHYRPPTKRALDNLSKQVIYFGAPRKFNDPYDIGTPPSVSKLTPEEYLQGCEARGIDNPVPKDVFDKTANLFLREEQIVLRNMSGIACFSEDNDNLLMWSHYADAGKGFCLGFDTNYKTPHAKHVDFTKQALKRIDYDKDLSHDDIRDMWLNGTEKSYAELFAYKAKVWEYEKEWRLFNSESCPITFDAEMLKCVFLGTEASESTIELVRAIVLNKYPQSVKLFWGYRSDSEFKVEFKPMCRTQRIVTFNNMDATGE